MLVLKKATQIELTPEIEEYIEKKIGGLKKYFASLDKLDAEARVEVGRLTAHHRKGNIFRAEVNLSFGKQLLRAEEEGINLHEAIDKTAANLKRQIINFHKKLITRRQQCQRLD